LSKVYTQTNSKFRPHHLKTFSNPVEQRNSNSGWSFVENIIYCRNSFSVAKWNLCTSRNLVHGWGKHTRKERVYAYKWSIE